MGLILNEFKYIINFRCHCQLVDYPAMPLICDNDNKDHVRVLLSIREYHY